MSADKITPRTDANGVLATIHRDGYWTNTMPAGQDPFPYLSQHGPIEVCLASELAALRAKLAERDAELAALKGHAERFMVEREGNSRQFARLQERLAKAEADCDAYLDDATRYSRHLKGAWMDSGDERDFYVWRDEAVQVDDAWWDKEGPSINAAIDASRKPS